jgi:hypothetical protein
MFGNPNISATPVTDIFSSQANLYGNSFANPMNSANMNSGWGIDPNLLTPSYQANYRPQYGGGQGYGNYGHTGFFGGLGRLSPLSTDVMWGNPMLQQQQAIEDVSSRPSDAGMWGFQHIAAPVAAFAAGRAVSRTLGLGWGMGRRFGSGLGGGLASGFGASGSADAWSGIKGAYSSGGIGEAASAFRGLGMGGTMNMAARGLGGTIFGAASALGTPIAIGQGIMYGAEKFITDPYINTRQTSRSLRSNFAGVSFGDAQGNAVSGRGLGMRESYEMAQSVTGQGIQDMAFSTSQYSQGADMIGRSGLMDNVGAGGITKRIKDSMAQVKLIMSIANMPEMKDAIEQLAKLQMAGASVSGGLSSTAASTMSRLGGFASMAGTSVQHLMNTVGAQGQYLYQANGMTPYLGQLAAASAYSAMAAGNRMGLISPAMMARMGGAEGATQASLTGQINASQTMFNKMANYNTYTNGKGGYGSDMLGIVQQFGQNMASDPLGTYGGMMLNSRQAAGKQMEARGSLAVQDQLMSIAKNIPGALDRNGNISAEKAAPFLMQMGMGMDDIQAYYAQRISETDEGSYNQRMRGLDSQLAEQNRQYISQSGTYGGVIGSAIYNTRKFGRNVTQGISRAIVNPITSAIGGTGDNIQRVTDSLWYGSTTGGNSNEDIGELLGGPAKAANNTNVSLFGGLRRGQNSSTARGYQGVADSVNELAKNGHADAVNYLKAKDPDEKRALMSKLLNSGVLGNNAKDDYSGFDGGEGLDEFLGKATRLPGADLSKTASADDGYNALFMSSDKVSPAPVDKSTAFTSELEKISGRTTGTKAEQLQSAGRAARVAMKNYTVGDAAEKAKTDPDLIQYMKDIGETDPVKAIKAARGAAVNSDGFGLGGLAETSLDLNRGDYGSEDEFLKAVATVNGGVHKNARSNAHDTTTQESVDDLRAGQVDASQRASAYQAYKSGRIDFSTYKQTTNALDSGKATTMFNKAVDKFVAGVETMTGNKVPTSGSKGTSTQPNPYGNDNRAVIG